MTDTRSYSKERELEEELVVDPPLTETEIKCYFGAMMHPKLNDPGLSDDYQRFIDEASYIILQNSEKKPDDIGRMLD